MAARPKVAYDREWVSTSMLSTRFKTDGCCELCRRATAGPVWFSIRTGKSRCKKCFTPEMLR